MTTNNVDGARDLAGVHSSVHAASMPADGRPASELIKFARKCGAQWVRLSVGGDGLALALSEVQLEALVAVIVAEHADRTERVVDEPLPPGGVISGYAVPVASARTEPIEVVRIESKVGPARWGVRHFGDYLNKDGVFEFQPTNSSRDDEYYQRCRYDTAAEALAAATRVATLL